MYRETPSGRGTGRLASYALAVSLPLLTILLRTAVAPTFQNRPLLIIFIFPIIISAMAGGLGPGLLATAVSAASVAYWTIPPEGSFQIAASHDLLQWGMLVLGGCLVSALSQMRLKQAAALRQSETQYRMLVETAREGIWSMDAGHRITLVNQAMAGLLGCSPEEIRGRRVEDFHFEQDKDAHAAQMDRRHCGVDETYETRLRRKDGAELWVQVAAKALVDESGRFLGSFAIFTDITERKRSETDMARARETAESANRAKSEFLAAMSHDIRTPLNGVMGMLTLLGATQPTPEQVEYIQAASLAAGKLTTLLSDILDLSKIEAGVIDIRPKPFNLSEVFASIGSLFGKAAADKGIGLRLEADGRIPAILVGDETRVRQILGNLIGNALKFTEAGFVALEALLVSPPGAHPCRVLFCVRDSGVGIGEERLADIFEPFAQVADSYTKTNEGVGLGLAIVKRLVHAMGGEVSLESSLNQGTSVYACLPFIPGEASLPAAALPVEEESLAGLRILLAEDEKVNRLATRRVLEKQGCIVASADNGAEAVQLALDRGFDVILMDVQMPVMDGLQAARTIREAMLQRGLAPIPILALTAHAMADDREKFLAQGMDGYLPKPLDFTSLIRTLQDLRAIRPAAG